MKADREQHVVVSGPALRTVRGCVAMQVGWRRLCWQSCCIICASMQALPACLSGQRNTTTQRHNRPPCV